MNAREMKALTGAKTLAQAISVLCARIEKREWKYGEDSARYAGFDYKKNRVHFSIIKPVTGGAVFYRKIAISMDDAIDCISGRIDASRFDVVILH